MTRHIRRALVLLMLSLACASCEGVGSAPAATPLSSPPSLRVPFDPHEAEAAIDRGDDAANRHDAETMNALLDDDILVSGSRVGPVVNNLESARAAVTANYTHAAAVASHSTRTALVMRPDETGTVVWFMADYDSERKPENGGAPEHRTVRESGVLVRRNGQWRFAMLHAAPLMPVQSAPAEASSDAGAEPSPKR